MVQKFRVTEGHAKGVRKVLPSGETEQEREYRLLCQWWRETLVDRHHITIGPQIVSTIGTPGPYQETAALSVTPPAAAAQSRP